MESDPASNKCAISVQLGCSNLSNTDNATVAAEAMLKGEASCGSLMSEGLAPDAELITSGSINVPLSSNGEQVSPDSVVSMRALAKSSAHSNGLRPLYNLTYSLSLDRLQRTYKAGW